MMKRLSSFFVALLITALSLGLCMTTLSARADDNDSKTRKGRYCNVAEAKKLRDDTRVIVRGYIVQRVADDHYLLQDSTGSIRIELDDDSYRKGSGKFRSVETAKFHGAAARDDDDDDDDDDDGKRRRKKRDLVDPRVRVEIMGKIDRDDGSVEIDVDILRRVK